MFVWGAGSGRCRWWELEDAQKRMYRRVWGWDVITFKSGLLRHLIQLVKKGEN